MNDEGEPRKGAAGFSELPESPEGRENIEKIRYLLFGSQVRNLETKLSRVEGRLQREIHEVRDEFLSRVDSLEMFTKNELETLVNRITSEHEQSAETVKHLTAQLRETVETFERRQSQLHNKVEQSAKEIREQLLAQAKRLTDEIVKRHDESTRALNESVAAVRAEYVSRSHLSRLFTELAVRLDETLASGMLVDDEEGGNG